MNKNKALTLIELLLILPIIGILATMVFSVLSAKHKQIDSQAIEASSLDDRLAAMADRARVKALVRQAEADLKAKELEKMEKSRPRVEKIESSNDKVIDVYYDWDRQVYVYRDLKSGGLTAFSAPKPVLVVPKQVEENGK